MVLNPLTSPIALALLTLQEVVRIGRFILHLVLVPQSYLALQLGKGTVWCQC
jgi:hypothetical protein